MTIKERNRKRAAALVIFTYEHERTRGKLKDPNWDSYLEDALNEAKRKGDPEKFTYALIIAMGLGGPVVPKEDRETIGEVMQRWADLAYKKEKK